MLRVQLEIKQPAQPRTSNSDASLVMQANSDRMASFQKVIERSHSQVTSLKASVNNIFQAVSAKRFRDVAPDIRALVIQGIAHWTTSLPADFLQDRYLKYVAWALSDRVINTAVSHATAISPLHGRLYSMMCWACQMLEAPAQLLWRAAAILCSNRWNGVLYNLGPRM